MASSVLIMLAPVSHDQQHIQITRDVLNKKLYRVRITREFICNNIRDDVIRNRSLVIFDSAQSAFDRWTQSCEYMTAETLNQCLSEAIIVLQDMIASRYTPS